MTTQGQLQPDRLATAPPADSSTEALAEAEGPIAFPERCPDRIIGHARARE